MPQKGLGTHRRLRVWRESLVIAEMVYKITADFPQNEQYGLTTQMRRAAISIVSNIAEGAARGSSRDFAKFLSIARGSLAELDSQVTLAARLGILRRPADLEMKLCEVAQMLTALRSAIKARSIAKAT